MVKALYITSEYTDYLQDQILIGLKQIEGVTCVDYPRKDVVYQDCTIPNPELYGNGFTIWKTIEENENIDRSNIYDRLYNGEFDAVVFGNIQRQKNSFQKINLERVDCPVAFLDGEDERFSPSISECIPFIREWLDRYQRGSGGRPQIGPALYQPAFREGKYFKREKSDYISENTNSHSISFSIPEVKILESKPEKEQKFQTHVQCNIAYKLNEVAENCTSEPIFASEEEYYNDLAASKYGITMKKGGWECMRHYEIAANWAIPCFYNLLEKPSECAPHGLRDLDNCVAFSSSKELIRKINYIEQNNLYEVIQKNALQWVKQNTCCRKADYILETVLD
jgi:hypothetical protein